MLPSDVKQMIDACVLCWLATSCPDGQPNVSPKELFTYSEDDHIIIANIASPQTIKNIKANPKVCVSFVEVFLQKGYQIKDVAKVISLKNASAVVNFERLQQLAGDKFTVGSLIQIQPIGVKEIVAPSYAFYPETTEAQMIVGAMKAYKVAHKIDYDG